MGKKNMEVKASSDSVKLNKRGRQKATKFHVLFHFIF